MKTLKELFQKQSPFLLIVGPCAIEGEEMAFKIALECQEIAKKHGIEYVFKGSFKKANRSKLDSFTGIGDVKALKILSKIRNDLKIPVTTDVHEVNDIEMAKEYVDIIQIPAFLARQTDLLVAAAKSGKIVNIKKGQFMDSKSMGFAVNKVLQSGNSNVLITERGNMFGYKDLVVDFRNIPKMKVYAPVILDVTHSLQKPNQDSGVTGGEPELIETIAKAGIVTGADGIFIETHFDPQSAKSDGKNMLPIEDLDELISKLVKIKSSI